MRSGRHAHKFQRTVEWFVGRRKVIEEVCVGDFHEPKRPGCGRVVRRYSSGDELALNGRKH